VRYGSLGRHVNATDQQAMALRVEAQCGIARSLSLSPYPDVLADAIYRRTTTMRVTPLTLINPPFERPRADR